MAKSLLWFIVIIGWLVSLINRDSISLTGSILIVSCICVLAICESIEKIGK